MFDRAQIKIKAGDGGDGVAAFRREKFVPYGGPDGGDGGRGGNVVIRASESESSLKKYRMRKPYRAVRGGDGSGNNRHGRDGADLVLTVPPGTVIASLEGEEKVHLADLARAGESVIVARGGKGGLGNTHFKSSTNQAPKIYQAGETGEAKTLQLDLMLIADVGIIGYPNAGKSTLLTAASAARPRVASYPFTTLEPMLGVVEIGLKTFILAEIPGLISGAHLGKGLGHDFLRHAMRTRVLVHLLGGDAASPINDMLRVNEELALFDISLASKQQIVVINKIDLPEVEARLDGIKKELAGAGIKAYAISAATGQGVPALMKEVLNLLIADKSEEKIVGNMQPIKVFRPQPRDTRVSINHEGDEYVVHAPELERIRGGVGVSANELRWQLSFQLKRLHIDKALEKAGAQPGDKIRLGNMTWEWYASGRAK
jgi:GTP-binding protein